MSLKNGNSKINEQNEYVYITTALFPLAAFDRFQYFVGGHIGLFDRILLKWNRLN